MNVTDMQLSGLSPSALDVRLIPMDDIIVENRLRVVDEDHANNLAVNMAATGQKAPVEVRVSDEPGKFILVSGGHRHRAAEIAGISALHAIVLDVNELEARLHEIDENLVRRELSALDRSVFLAERKAVWEELYPEVKHGTNRFDGRVAKFATLDTKRFSAEIAEKLGISERSIQLAVSRANAIPVELRSKLIGTPIADNGSELDKLAKLGPRDMAKVVKVLEAADFQMKVAAAIAQVMGVREPEVSDEDRQYDALIGAWRKAGGAARRRFEDMISAEQAAQNEDRAGGKRRRA